MCNPLHAASASPSTLMDGRFKQPDSTRLGNKNVFQACPVHAAGGSKKGSQVNYVRQTPKFLQAHAHLLGRGAQGSAPGAEGAPEGASIAALEDEPPEDVWDDDGVRAQAGQGAQLGRLLRLLW